MVGWPLPGASILFPALQRQADARLQPPSPQPAIPWTQSQELRSELGSSVSPQQPDPGTCP